MKKAITVKFPAPMPAEVPCPICSKEEGKRGSGCLGCNWKGKMEVTVDAKIPIQRDIMSNATSGSENNE